MADKTTTSLTAGTTPLAGSELVYGIQGGNSRKFTASDVAQSPHTQGWGTITATPTTLGGYGITDAATSAQGALADSAVQPGDLAAVATSGDYDDLINLPTLGTAAATDATDYATAAQGATADSALQPGDIGTSVQAQGTTLTNLEGLALVSGDIIYATGADTLQRLPKGTDGQILNLTAGLPAWSSVAGTGDMVAAIYDPQAIAADAFDQDNMTDGAVNKNYTATEQTKLAGIATGATANSSDATLLARANHTGVQAISTVTGLQTALDDKLDYDLPGPVVLTDWEPDYSFRRYVTQTQWNDIIAGTQATALSVEIQNAEDDVNAKGGGFVRYPAGLIPVDGYKGAETTFNISRKGGLYVMGGVKHIGVPGKTIWKNIANDWRCLVSAREGSDWGIEGITLDGDLANRPTVLASTDVIRGEGIIFWNEVSAMERVAIRNTIIMNTGHYGCGVQNVDIRDFVFEGNLGLNCGGDFLDIKAYPAYPKPNMKIHNNAARGIGTNWAGRLADGDGPQAAFDIRGICEVSNNYVYDLDSYDVSQLGNDGFRVNADVDSNEFRKGGAKSILTNNHVFSAKLDNEGTAAVKRIRGFVITDERVSVIGGYAENCYIGMTVQNSADSVCDYSQVYGFHAKNCKGSDGSGLGLVVPSGSKGHQLYATVEGCDTGFQGGCTGSTGRIVLANNTLGNSCTVAQHAANTISFVNAGGNTTLASVTRAENNFNGATLWGANNPYLEIRSTFDGAWTTPFSNGGMRVSKEDVSGSGAAVVGLVEYRHNNSTAASGGWAMTGYDGTALVDVATFTTVKAFIAIGAIPTYASEAAATTGGLTSGTLYKSSDGVMRIKL